MAATGAGERGEVSPRLVAVATAVVAVVAAVAVLALLSAGDGGERAADGPDDDEPDAPGEPDGPGEPDAGEDDDAGAGDGDGEGDGGEADGSDEQGTDDDVPPRVPGVGEVDTSPGVPDRGGQVVSAQDARDGLDTYLRAEENAFTEGDRSTLGRVVDRSSPAWARLSGELEGWDEAAMSRAQVDGFRLVDAGEDWFAAYADVRREVQVRRSGEETEEFDLRPGERLMVLQRSGSQWVLVEDRPR